MARRILLLLKEEQAVPARLADKVARRLPALAIPNTTAVLVEPETVKAQQVRLEAVEEPAVPMEPERLEAMLLLGVPVARLEEGATREAAVLPEQAEGGVTVTTPAQANLEAEEAEEAEIICSGVPAETTEEAEEEERAEPEQEKPDRLLLPISLQAERHIFYRNFNTINTYDLAQRKHHHARSPHNQRRARVGRFILSR